MTVKLGLLALLEAKPGKGDELGAFLEAGRALAVQEAGTVTWYAFKISDTDVRHLRLVRDRGRPPSPPGWRDPHRLGPGGRRPAGQGPRHPHRRRHRRQIARRPPPTSHRTDHRQLT